jgi:chloramphenicol 3-O phosphotransferase
MAEWQADLVHNGVVYDLEVDTTTTAAIDCARVIAAHT